MNATPPVSHTLIASKPAQPSTAGQVNSAQSGANGQGFAAALRNAGAKPTRKAVGAKRADAGSIGGHLPAPGNLSPPPPAPVAPGSSAAASATATIAGTLGVAAPSGAAGSTGAGTTAAGTAAVGTATAGTAAAGTAAAGTAAVGTAAGIAAGTGAISGAQAKIADQNSGGASGDSPVAASGGQGAARPGAGSTLALGLPVVGLGAAAAPKGDGATTGAAAGVAATAKGAAAATAAAASAAQAGAAAGLAAGTGAGAAASTATKDAAGTAVAASTAPAGARAGSAARSVGKPITGAAATAAISAATSGPTGATDGNTAPSTNTGAWTNTDATTQAVTAAAMSAAATGAVAPGDAGIAGAADQSSTPDGLATPATGGLAQGAQGRKGPPVPALATSVSNALPAAWAKAATAAPAATALASASAADKRAPSGTGDSLLTGLPGDGMAGAAQLSVGTTGVTDATPTPTLKVTAGVDTPEFGQGLADRVSWMVDNNLNGAKLQVNPPQLGPIEVQIAVQGNHAHVWLTSHSAVTRDALESSSPKLREMLGAQGFGQVSVDISQRSYQERSAYSQPYQWAPSASPGASAAAVQSTASSLPRISNGAVDAYA